MYRTVYCSIGWIPILRVYWAIQCRIWSCPSSIWTPARRRRGGQRPSTCSRPSRGHHSLLLKLGKTVVWLIGVCFSTICEIGQIEDDLETIHSFPYQPHLYTTLVPFHIMNTIFSCCTFFCNNSWELDDIKEFLKECDVLQKIFFLKTLNKT